MDEQVWFNPLTQLDVLLRSTAAELEAFDETFAPEVRPAEPRFGDFQANGVLPFAKRKRTNPRQLATTLVDALKESGALAGTGITIEIAGPGFINFTLGKDFLLEWLLKHRTEDDLRQGASATYKGRVVLVDYPSPNTAKQMHIGHLRPMVIGEAIQRLLRFCGAKVIRDNHIGDWGTNFGTLIMAIKREGYDLDNPGADPLEEIERLYKQGTQAEKGDPSLREKSLRELVKLQQGDPENTRLWEKINEVSRIEFHRMYKRFGLVFEAELGESFYRDKVERVWKELTEAGIAEESEGALVIFIPGHPRFSREAERPQPFIIRKKDGASNYAATDLATVLYRLEHFKAEQIVYITDARQQDHFQQLFLTTGLWFEETDRELPQLDHVWFGKILGDDGKALKTRSGEPIKLKALLDEAEERALAIVKERSPDLPEDQQREIARVVGIGAIRYADLMQSRTQDYTFTWDKLLNLQGNSAAYLLYAVARIYNVFLRAGVEPGEGEDDAGALEDEEEIALARKLIGFVNVLDLAVADLRPHVICNYLYDLAGVFSSFYDKCRVVVDEPEVKARRLVLCARTLRIMETGLQLLGLETLRRM